MAAESYFARADHAADLGTPSVSMDEAARFCIWHAPQGVHTVRGIVVHAHSFAEEMNKSRRMVALQARSLAAAGFAVLQFDFFGCGDSAGDFADATWERWLKDLRWAAAHARERATLAGFDAQSLPLWVWGHRVGALLAVQVVEATAGGEAAQCNLLLWQPTLQGKQALQQFLRLKAAAAMMDGGGKGVVDALRRELTAGRSVEVGGYRIAPGLAQGLDAATLQPPRRAARAVWLELSGPAMDNSPPTLSPGSTAAIERWRKAGWQVDATVLSGPTFWQTTEIEDAPALVEHGSRVLATQTA